MAGEYRGILSRFSEIRIKNESVSVFAAGRSEKICKHPPERLYAWYARDDRIGRVLCVCCCECGKVLVGGIRPTVGERDGEK